MLDGQLVVFLSCSERFKVDIARPVREALAAHRIRGIIVADEPFLPIGSSDPEGKVESYLDASDAFVSLCTPDDQLADGSRQPRQNVVDEYARARRTPRLRDRMLVFRARDVKLPSNINPVHEPLTLDDPSTTGKAIVAQLRAWGMLPAIPPEPAPRGKVEVDARELIAGLALGDHDEANRRAYQIMTTATSLEQTRVVEALGAFLLSDRPVDDEVHRANSVLEAMHRFDPGIVPVTLIEQLADSPDHARRMSAAMMLWDRAEVLPGSVPLGLVGRLALPMLEDWYVFAPALACAKQLLLARRTARVVFDQLAASGAAEDRYVAAAALLDVARVDPLAVPEDLVARLAEDADELVAEKGREVASAILKRDRRAPFGL